MANPTMIRRYFGDTGLHPSLEQVVLMLQHRSFQDRKTEYLQEQLHERTAYKMGHP